jgi:hypothetical protein
LWERKQLLAGLLLPFFFDLLESFAGVFCSSICFVLISSTWELLSAQPWRCCLHCYGGDDVVHAVLLCVSLLLHMGAVVCTAVVEMVVGDAVTPSSHLLLSSSIVWDADHGPKCQSW